MRLRDLPRKELIAHAAIITVPVVVFLALCWIRLAPSGKFVVDVNPTERSPYIDHLLPLDRTEEQDDILSIVNDPVYAAVHLPGSGYTSAHIAIEFRLYNQSLFEIGAITDIFTQSAALKPLAFTTLDSLSWPVTQQNKWRLWSADTAPESIEGFFANNPERSSVATFHAELPGVYREPAYRPTTTRIITALRGAQRFATYTSGGPLEFSLVFQDENRAAGSDALDVRVWNEAGEPVVDLHIDDDGDTTAGGVASGLVAFPHTTQSFPEGVYTFELSSTSDIVWRAIEINQRYATFLNRLDLAESTQPLSFVTDAKSLTVETSSASSPNTLTISDRAIDVSVRGTKVYAVVEEAGIVVGSADPGPIRITGDGLFAFTRDSFFNPYPIKLGATTDLEARGIQAVLATYQPPHDLGEGWKRATAEIDLTTVAVEDGAIKLVFSAPQIANVDGVIDIRRIRISFHKEPMSFGDILDRIGSYFGL